MASTGVDEGKIEKFSKEMIIKLPALTCETKSEINYFLVQLWQGFWELENANANRRKLAKVAAVRCEEGHSSKHDLSANNSLYKAELKGSKG